MSISKISIVGNQILKDDQILCKVGGEIVAHLLLNDRIAVLLNGSELTTDRNILCFNTEGILLWQIPEPDQLHQRNYYTSVYLTSKQELKAYNQNGVEVTIDKDTGSILDAELIK